MTLGPKLIALFVGALPLVASGQAPPAAAYAFSEGAGTTTADASGAGVVGALKGGAGWTTGHAGGGLSLDGSTGYVDLGNPAGLRFTGSMTVSAWVRETANVGDDGQIAAKADGSSGWQLKSSPDTGVRTYGFSISNSSGAPIQRFTRTVRTLGTWYHVAGVYDAAAGGLHVYLNGVLDDGVLNGTVPSSQRDSTVSVNLGRRTGGFNLAGAIDDVRIYGRALTVAEIQADMNTPLAGGAGDLTPPSTPAGLAAAALSSSSVGLSWLASTDAVGVAGYRIYRGGAQVGTSATPAFTDAGLAPATAYTYEVAAYDLAANLSARSAPGSATTAAAGSATVALTAPAANAYVLGTATTLSATATAPAGVAGVQFLLDGAGLGAEDQLSPYSVVWNTTTAADGPHALSARAREPSGTTTASAIRTVTVDNGRPSGTVVVNGGAPATSSRTATLTLGATDATSGVAQMRFSNTGTSYSTAEAFAASKVWTLSTGAGTKTVWAQFRDGAGNWSAATSDTIVLDTTAPTLSAVASAAAGAGARLVTWTTNEAATSQVEYGLTTALGTLSPLDPGLVLAHSVTLGGLASGTYSFRVRSRDAAGNEAVGTVGAFTISGPDLTPPTAPQFLSATVQPSEQVLASWSDATDDVGVSGYLVLRDGVQVGATAATFFLDAGVVHGATYTYEVKAVDAAGNVSPASPGATVTVIVPAGDPPVPTLVQHLASTSQPLGQGEAGNNYVFTLPNPVLPGNCLILGIAQRSGTSFAATPVTDGNGNAWPTTPAASIPNPGGDMALAIFVLPNARPGLTTITVHFTAALQPFSYTVSEFRGVATTSPVSGSSGAGRVLAPGLHTGTFTPANNDAGGGNLIWSFFWADDTFGHEVTRFTAGGPFTLLDANIFWHATTSAHSATEYYVQPVAAPITPGMTATMASNSPFVGLSVALRAASAGTAPGPGIRIVKVLHFTNEIPGAQLTLQAPTVGNLLVLASSQNSSLIDVTGVTDNAGGAYVKVQPTRDVPQFWIAANHAPGPNLLVTLTSVGSRQPTSWTAYDITGASGAPIGASAGHDMTVCDGSSTLIDYPVLTPTAPNGLTLAACELGQGPGLGFAAGAPAGAIWDFVYYDNERDFSTMNNADCRGHLYTSSTAVQHWNWRITNNPSNSCDGTAVHLLQ